MIQTAKKRIGNEKLQGIKEYNQKVYYSSLALKDLFETMLDENFLKVVGEIDQSNFIDFDIIEWGKGIEEAQKDLEIFA